MEVFVTRAVVQSGLSRFQFQEAETAFVPSVQDFDKKLAEADAYLQILIDQLKVSSVWAELSWYLKQVMNCASTGCIKNRVYLHHVGFECDLIAYPNLIAFLASPFPCPVAL